MEVQRRKERYRQGTFNTISEYRDVGCPFETQNSSTHSWSVLSFPIAPTVWFQHYRELEGFLQTNGDDNCILYVHGAVFVPFDTVLYSHLCFIITHPIPCGTLLEPLGSGWYLLHRLRSGIM